MNHKNFVLSALTSIILFSGSQTINAGFFDKGFFGEGQKNNADKGSPQEHNFILEDATTEEIYEEANKEAEQGNHSAKRSLEMLKSAIDINRGTFHELQNQNTQIQKMDEDLYNHHKIMQQSERKLRSIESVWGSIANKFTPSTQVSIPEKKKNSKKAVKNDRKNPPKKSRTLKDKSEYKLAPWSDPTLSEEDRYKMITQDTDKTVNQISAGLDQLKGIVTQIGDELNESSNKLDKLNSDVIRETSRTAKITGKTRKILGQS